MKKYLKQIVGQSAGSEEEQSLPQERMSTSISDNQAYPQVCLDASMNYALFNEFRRNPTYNAILEHVSEKAGQEYLDVFSGDSQIMAKIEDYKENDAWGNPRVYEYPGVGVFSPTTLRYIKVLYDLKQHFGGLDGFDICEIGVGYGGQCRIVHSYFTPARYCLVDIQPALALTQRFLGNYPLRSEISYRTMNELGRSDYDLVVSNYAFTELPRTVQDVYLEKVILKSKRGYITYNEISPESFRSYKLQELCDIIPGVTVHEEEPLTSEKNRILVW